MTITPKFLWDGQLAEAEGELYKSTGSSAYIKSITLYNSATFSNECNLFIQRGTGTSRQFLNYPLPSEISYILDVPLILEDTDSLRGYAVSGSSVNVFIFGAVE